MVSHDQTLSMLRSTGHRITVQRQTILEIIETSTEHLDAETIYYRAKQKDENISLATVYRTLTVLKEMGLIEQRFLARDHSREHYEPVGAPEHYHLTCQDCRTVIEFQSPRVNEMRQELQQTLGIEITRVCICVEGYCADCTAKRQTTETRE